jgi:hypothetical protein
MWIDFSDGAESSGNIEWGLSGNDFEFTRLGNVETAKGLLKRPEQAKFHT